MPRNGEELKAVTINTLAYEVPAGKTDRRSESITTDEDMRVVAIEHFIGISSGGWLSDNGHILSKSPDNPGSSGLNQAPAEWSPLGPRDTSGTAAETTAPK